MKRLSFLIALLVFFNWSGSTRAATAAEYASFCRPFEKPILQEGGRIFFPPRPTANRCWGAFAAIQYLFNVNRPGEDVPLLGVCLPPESYRTQLIQVFLKYADQHPEKTHENFTAMVWSAFVLAFPCPPSKKVTR